MWTRRALLAGVGAAATPLAGCTGLGGNGGGSDDRGSDGAGDDGTDGDGGSVTPPTGAVATAPVPSDPSAYTYARMGTAGEPVVTYVGNWKCPFCAEFSVGSERVLPLSRVVRDFVAEGAFDLAYRALCYRSDGEPFLGPDAPRAGRAGLAVWNVDPGSYWAFHERVMANQPPESKRWATRERLVEFAREAGVSDPGAVGDAVANGDHEEPVRANTSFAADAGVEGTPALVVDGTAYSPFEPDPTRNALQDLADRQ